VAVIAETEEDEPPRADVFDLMNIVPYVRKFKTSEWHHYTDPQPQASGRVLMSQTRYRESRSILHS
jgi:hypothetical protein